MLIRGYVLLSNEKILSCGRSRLKIQKPLIRERRTEILDKDDWQEEFISSELMLNQTNHLTYSILVNLMKLGLIASPTTPFFLQCSTSSAWFRYGWHSTWLTAGFILPFSIMSSTCLLLKFDNPKQNNQVLSIVGTRMTASYKALLRMRAGHN